jgi:hypothetical protein
MSMHNNDKPWPNLVLHLEAASFEELRIAACNVLDLRIQNATQAALKVQELGNELPQTKPAPETNQPDPDADNGKDVANEAAGPGNVEPAPAKKTRAPRKPKDKGNGAEPSVIETAAAIEASSAKVSLETVRSAFDVYVQKFGVAAAQIDGPIILGRIYGPAIGRIKDIPEDDTGKMGRVIAAVEGAILTNEFGREAVQ